MSEKPTALVRENVSRDAGGLIHSPPGNYFLPHSVDDLQYFLTNNDQNKNPITVRGGGKTTEGECLANAEETLLHLRSLNKVEDKVINKEDPSIWVEGGATFQELQNKLWSQGWDVISAPLNITASVGGTVGVGGIDVNSAFQKCTADQVLELDVLLADGTRKRLSEEQEPELFEAVLYGYGQFAIVVGARMKLKPYSPIRMEYLYHHRLDSALDDLIRLEKDSLCDHVAILTLMDDICCVIAAFESDHKWKAFLDAKHNYDGFDEPELAFRKVVDMIANPFRLSRLPFLLKSRQRILTHLNDPAYMKEGWLHNRHAAFGKLIWNYWGRQPIVIPDLSLTMKNFKQGVLEGNEICRRYFSRYTLYIILVQKHPWKPRYDMGPFPETEDTLLGGVEFEPLFQTGTADPEKIQAFKNDIYDLGVKLGGRAYRFGGSMKEYAQRMCGPDHWNNFLKQKEQYDPHHILNPRVLL